MSDFIFGIKVTQLVNLGNSEYLGKKCSTNSVLLSLPFLLAVLKYSKGIIHFLTRVCTHECV